MSELALGESVVAAQEFLWSIHKQTAMLLNSLDGLMAMRGRTPTHPTRVSGDISTRLKPDGWLVRYLYRFYFLNDAKKDHISGLIINLWPTTGFTVPVCLAFAAKFGSPTSHEELWRSWKDTRPVFRALRDAIEDGTALCPVEKRYAKRFLPIATSLMGRVIGLCSLKDEDTLKVQVVEPLIAATDQFGRKSPESKGGLFGPV